MTKTYQTTVISVRGRKRAELLADPNFIYVGRNMPRQGWKDLGWGNQFTDKTSWNAAVSFLSSLLTESEIERLPDMATLETVLSRGLTDPVELHHLAVIHNPTLVTRLPELRGKTLGCWCGRWEPGQPLIRCHAVTLARLANRLEARS